MVGCRGHIEAGRPRLVVNRVVGGGPEVRFWKGWKRCVPVSIAARSPLRGGSCMLEEGWRRGEKSFFARARR